MNETTTAKQTITQHVCPFCGYDDIRQFAEVACSYTVAFDDEGNIAEESYEDADMAWDVTELGTLYCYACSKEFNKPRVMVWEPTGDEEVDVYARLYLENGMRICGCSMHIEAVAVVGTEHGGQEAAPGSHYGNEAFGWVHAGVSADGPWRTVQIEVPHDTLSTVARKYVLIATPFCD